MSAFVTVDDYNAAFQTTADEDAVQFALDAACTQIRKYLSQDLDLVTDDEQPFDGTGHQTLLLPQLPVLAVNSVFIDKDEDTEEEVTDYKVGFGGILYRRCGWPWGVQNITVDYDHGFEEIPADLKSVALGIARFVATPITEEALGGITSETIGGYSYTRDLGAASSVATTGSDVSAYSRVLDLYRVKRIPVP